MFLLLMYCTSMNIHSSRVGKGLDPIDPDEKLFRAQIVIIEVCTVVTNGTFVEILSSLVELNLFSITVRRVLPYTVYYSQ